MDLPTGPLTLLDGVNELLAAARESSVTSLFNLKASGVQALEHIQRANFEQQQRPWYFNSEEDLTLAIGADGRVPLPANATRVVMGAYDRGWRDYVKRGAFLYDRREHTFVFQTAPRVDVVWALPFDDTPPAFRWHTVCLAGRRFVSKELASTAGFKFADVEVAAAWQRFLEEEDASRGDTLVTTSPHFAQWGRRR